MQLFGVLHVLGQNSEHQPILVLFDLLAAHRVEIVGEEVFFPEGLGPALLLVFESVFGQLGVGIETDAAFGFLFLGRTPFLDSRLPWLFVLELL